MDAATDIADPSPRAQALAREIAELVRERKSGDPRLGAPDVLVALELTKARVLEDSGVAAAGRRIFGVVAAVVLLVMGFLLVAMVA